MKRLLRTVIIAIISLTVSIPVSAMNRSIGTYTALSSFQYRYKMAVRGGQPYKFGGKELITANGLNEYDFGARQYYSAVPGFTRPDNLAEKYSWLSPYLYCANNPVNAFDPDGNIIIFVNGMHTGDGGKPQYWNGVDNAIANAFKDNRTLYLDGSFGGIYNLISSGFLYNNYLIKNRIKIGYDTGNKYAESIYRNLSKNETIKIIAHSMGAAFAKGFIEALL